MVNSPLRRVENVRSLGYERLFDPSQRLHFKFRVAKIDTSPGIQLEPSDPTGNQEMKYVTIRAISRPKIY